MSDQVVDMSVLNSMTDEQLQQHIRDLKPEQIHAVKPDDIKAAMAAVTPQQVQTILNTMKKEADLASLVAGLSEAQLQAAVASITEPTKRAAAEALDLSNEEQQQKLLAQMSESKRKIITPQGC
jgi:Mg/Co/Ni transporter MgtE|uniref:Magnesium transporter MgtE intracellular domain-containing protein n=1 Tax=Eutreptiella gymnastica TaxID=73025 RepID=A0A7S4FJG6_9EUGL|eukprot:CAMPEP_0174287512 /NCGR_PEP_ID=MMETSP0809-20121228/16142_1 /TAXON_ID=73025 ORGANISM="Eutreptiella gymnastica-like, Strain CCMP1594" /NCGR_SAMPLE_ID=MMETSP0809 /ASSEMBLY_ACC=CAM_ASM_000658 /LENGTH=123 /DNA_ID=CAMNT_0015384085 /DNA_START=27 /DNA_END=398 /DNA_ORIENTATION=+